jgi:MinD superfamily P-loop ATPase
LNDLKLAVETVKKLEVPCGIIVNRVGANDDKLEEFCLKEQIPVLMTIPLNMEIARLYSRGITLARGMPTWRENFVGLFKQIQEQVDERSRCLKR